MPSALRVSSAKQGPRCTQPPQHRFDLRPGRFRPDPSSGDGTGRRADVSQPHQIRNDPNRGGIRIAKQGAMGSSTRTSGDRTPRFKTKQCKDDERRSRENSRLGLAKALSADTSSTDIENSRTISQMATEPGVLRDGGVHVSRAGERQGG